MQNEDIQDGGNPADVARRRYRMDTTTKQGVKSVPRPWVAVLTCPDLKYTVSYVYNQGHEQTNSVIQALALELTETGK